MNSRWTCEAHGAVDPLQAAPRPGGDALAWLLKHTRVPVWLPWPLLPGWFVSGMTYAGDERRGGRASVVACSGPAPFGGVGELVLVAEEPGVGLGARFAGVDGTDPGPEVVSHPPGARLEAAGWPTQLWSIPRDPDTATDRAAWVGEAGGLWLWLVTWPGTAGLLLPDGLCLVDLCKDEYVRDLPYGAPSPRLSGPD